MNTAEVIEVARPNVGQSYRATDGDVGEVLSVDGEGTVIVLWRDEGQCSYLAEEWTNIVDSLTPIDSEVPNVEASEDAEAEESPAEGSTEEPAKVESPEAPPSDASAEPANPGEPPPPPAPEPSQPAPAFPSDAENLDAISDELADTQAQFDALESEKKQVMGKYTKDLSVLSAKCSELSAKQIQARHPCSYDHVRGLRFTWDWRTKELIKTEPMGKGMQLELPIKPVREELAGVEVGQYCRDPGGEHVARIQAVAADSVVVLWPGESTQRVTAEEWVHWEVGDFGEAWQTAQAEYEKARGEADESVTDGVTQEDVLGALTREGQTISQIAQFLSTDGSEVKPHLLALLEAGKVAKDGQARGTTYRLAEATPVVEQALDGAAEKLLSVLEDEGQNLAQLREKLSWDNDSIKDTVRILIEKGLARQTGQARGTKYHKA